MRTFWNVAKIMVPVMLAVRLAEQFGLSAWMGKLLAPVMALVGLPGEAGLVWAIALLTGLYGGIGAVIALVETVDLTALQLNVLLTMILFAHGIPVEQAIARKAGASFTLTTVTRLVSALLFGFLLFHIGSAVGALSGAATLGILPEPGGAGGWTGWLASTARTLALMFAVLLVLLAIIDGMKRIGAFDWLTARLAPFFAWLGIAAPLAPLVTIGMLLGLTYGGGLIIEETRQRSFTARELFVPLAGLSIIHALIEDTLVIIALGADVWVIVVWRTLFALAFIAVLAWIVRHVPERIIAPAGRAH